MTSSVARLTDMLLSEAVLKNGRESNFVIASTSKAHVLARTHAYSANIDWVVVSALSTPWQDIAKYRVIVWPTADAAERFIRTHKMEDATPWSASSMNLPVDLFVPASSVTASKGN